MSASPGLDESADPPATTLEHGEAYASATAYVSAPDFAGNSFSKSRNLKSLSGERIISDAVGAGDPADYYKFSVAKTADFRLELAGLSADLEVSLFDSKKRLIASSNNPEAAGELIARQLAKGTYYVLVGRVGDAAGGYNLTLTAALDAAGDSRKSAAKLGALSTSTVTVGDRIGGIDGHDYYKFSVSSATNVNLSLAELTGDANLSLYNSKGRLVAGSSQSGTSSEELSLTLAKGTYYLDVTPGFGVVADYRLSVTTGPRSAQGSVPSNGSPAPTAPTAPTNPSSPTTPTSPSTGVTPLPNVPTYGGANDWHLNSINAPESWSAGYTGRGVIVAVLDTGIDYNHSEFAGRIWTNAGEIAGNGLDDDGNGFADDVHGWNFVEVNADPLDESGHGTHVAGLIAAARNNVGSTGVAYDATIMPIQVLAANGASYTDDIAAGVYYAVDNGAKIINMSLGAGADTYVLREAIAYAAQHGVLIVAASGNTSAATPDWPARYSSMFDNVISVGSYGAQNGHSSFSNVVGTSQSVQVDAPGESIYSTLRNNSYGTYTGTSMATPQVAGLAALMLSANPNLTAAQMRSLIVASSDRAISGSDSHGGINAAWAVAAALRPEEFMAQGGVSSNASSGSASSPASGSPTTPGEGTIVYQSGLASDAATPMLGEAPTIAHSASPAQAARRHASSATTASGTDAAISDLDLAFSHWAGDRFASASAVKSLLAASPVASHSAEAPALFAADELTGLERAFAALAAI